jgi:GNAT superfamily N-acetyltransferase
VSIDFLPPTAADDPALVADLTRRINAAYGAAEEELWFPGNERIESTRVAEIVQAGELAVARIDERVVGSIRIRAPEAKAGYFGLLAVDPAEQGRGIGRDLIRFAEDVSRERGADWMELRLLVPGAGTNPGKTLLYDWYSRLGYETTERADFAETHPEFVDTARMPLDVLTMRKRL